MLPRPADRAEAFLVEAGHAPAHAAAMALSLLPDAQVPARVRQQVRPYRHLKMTPDERDGFATSLLNRRVLAEGMLLTLQGDDVRDSAVVSAHGLCEARTATTRPLQLRIGGSQAAKDQIREARKRLLAEVDELDQLIEAVTDTGADLSMKNAGPKANPRVVHLQNRLNTLGHRVLPDGVFGPVTDEAVKDFQTNAGLPANGVVDNLTAHALRRGGRLEVDAQPGLVPNGKQPPAAPGDGTNRETGNQASQDAPAEKASQPAEKDEGASTQGKEQSDAKKALQTTKQGGKSVSVNVKLSEGHDLNEAIGPIKKGAFHAWLGKDPDEPITDADIARGIAAGGHPARMARFAKAAKRWSRKKKKVQEGMCECGAPDLGRGVCQRGHRIEEGAPTPKAPEEPEVEEADAKADFPQAQVCPECGAKILKSGVCQRGHRARKLMEATHEQLVKDGILQEAR